MRWPVVPWTRGRSDLKVPRPSWSSQDVDRFEPMQRGRYTSRSAEGTQSMKLDAVVREGHGGELALNEAHVDAISFGVSEADLDVQGIRGRLSASSRYQAKMRRAAPMLGSIFGAQSSMEEV